MTQDTTQTTQTGHGSPWQDASLPEQEPILHFVIAWSLDEPERIGEVARADSPCVLGRGEPLDSDPAARVQFMRQRPSVTTTSGPLLSPRVSRLQLVIEPREDTLDVQSVGRCPLLVNGAPCERSVLQEGDTITLKDALVLLVVRRPATLPSLRSYPTNLIAAFGAPDAHGLVGESPETWQLRDDLGFAARSGQHVLLHGETGVGKEIGARAIHALSARAGHKLVARNAATLADSSADSELFGTVRDYPRQGVIERPGLLEEANGSTLFLDEVGELSERIQAHLMRVLDQSGEYQRLGDTQTRRAELCFVAATNRPLDQLKHDFTARFTQRVHVAGLSERREDIPLLIHWLLCLAARKDPQLAQRFFQGEAGESRRARLDSMLVEGLLRHRYTQHVRELERLLWLALGTSSGNFVALTPEVRAELVADNETRNSPEPSRTEIENALRDAEGNVTQATRALGLRNRFVLYRLIKRHGIVLRSP
ncbi:MAG TPA: sigma 54-interacting transcriptional regulator [Polyangiaceae bacterium]|nr:sigma 54-interacting transcriptional regulator [Polyangiaceae bacterium]